MDQRQIYTPRFLEIHRISGSKLPPQTWYHHVGRKIQQFQNPANVFRPVALNVRTASDPMGGTTRILVNPTDNDWYHVLKDEFKKIMKLPISMSIKIQTPIGTGIESMGNLRLRKVGELQIINERTGSPVYIEKTAQPSKRMATDKSGDLREWYTDELRDGLVQVVRECLQGKQIYEINDLMVGNGVVHNAMAEYIEESVPDWKSFLDTYALDDLARDINLNDTHETSMKIAEGFLKRLRAGMAANEAHVRTFFAQKKASDNPLFKQHIATGISKYDNDGVMWKDIAEDVFYSGRTASISSHIIKQGFRRYSNVSCSSSKRSKGKKKGKGKGKGKGKNYHSNSCISESIGNKRAMKMYHLFSNKHAFPGTILKKKPSFKPMPGLVPIERSMPDLVPIEQVVTATTSSLPRLIPIHGDDVPTLRSIIGEEVDDIDVDGDLFVDDAPNLEDFL
jgi:hypothetical protein